MGCSYPLGSGCLTHTARAEQGWGAHVPFCHTLGVPFPLLSPTQGSEVVLSLCCLSRCLHMLPHACSHVFASMGV